MSVKPDHIKRKIKNGPPVLPELASQVEALLANTGTGIYVLQGKIIIYSNPFFARLSGYPRQRLTGTLYLNLVHPDDRGPVEKHLTSVLGKNCKACTCEHRMLKKNGEALWVREHISPMEYSEGRAVLGSVVDISPHKMVEDALVKAEQRYGRIMDSMLDSYYEVDLAGNFTFLNASTCWNLGYEKGELDGKNFRLITPEYEIDRVFDAFHKVYETGEPNMAFAHRILRKDGFVGFGESSVSLLRDMAGDPIGFLCVGRNVTQRKVLEDALAASEERYRNMLDSMLDAYYEVDLTGNFTYINPATSKILGYEKGELDGRNYTETTPEDEIQKVFNAFHKVYETGEPNAGFTHGVIRKDRTKGYTETAIGLLLDKRGRPAGFSCLGRDISERVKLEEALKLSEEKYRTILEEMQDACYEIDLAGNFTFVNDATERHAGYARDELLKMNFRQLTFEEDISPLFSALTNVFWSGEPNKGYYHRIVRNDGSMGHMEAAISLLSDKLGKTVGFRCVSRDVTERRLLEQRLADMATHDFLTGLPNRILLNDRFQVALAQANRNNYKLGIVSLDLDHFKEVNDHLGHTVGDHLLKAAGVRLSTILRSSDTVARLGGDEFLLLLQEIHYPEDAVLIARKIIDSCKMPLHIDGFDLHISTSIGLAIYPDHGEDMDTLMRKSDAAMYHSKRHGGMQYKVFTSQDQQDISLP